MRDFDFGIIFENQFLAALTAGFSELNLLYWTL
jgi:hypothetical protein